METQKAGYTDRDEGPADAFRKKKPKLSLLARIIRFFTRPNPGKRLIDRELDKLHKLLVKEGEKVVRLEEDEIQEAMARMGGIMVAMLTVYFRKGKKSGFRIPEDLEERWGV